MDKTACYQLGYIAKLHGYKGEVSLFLDVTDPSEYKKLDQLMIELDGHLSPFFIERYQLKTKGFATVKFEGIDSEEAARVLLRKNAYLPAAELPELGNKNFYDHEVVGFKLIDINYGEVGTIVQIIDLAVNPLIQVDAKGKEVLIPLLDGLVHLVDREKRELHVESPEGLIDLYL